MNTKESSFWKDTWATVNETPRMFFGTVTDIARVFGSKEEAIAAGRAQQLQPGKVSATGKSASSSLYRKRNHAVKR